MLLSIYKANLDSIFYLKCNLHSISSEGGPRARTWGCHGDALGMPREASASLMSVQLQSRTPSVDGKCLHANYLVVVANFFNYKS